ncbi:protein of unknown function [Xenorhabdus poinarii G6]|uniref:Pesticidal crystal protein N-terminal domain-containing protein n=1 Tax=Xenorhabdus poinarii G6 TaxID=1354304 RepID=A0A068R2K1_9GAMM|nr:hypothetical protein [Xenorhabdus poinarii]CDG21413.1 protein of unknown function [Xenorhabdus poinarii G6]
MKQTSAEPKQLPLYILTLRALNMIPPQSEVSLAAPRLKQFAITPWDITLTFLGIILKYLFEKLTESKKEVDIIEVIKEVLIQHTTEWLESEYAAVRKDAESLQDAIHSWNECPTEEARQLVVDRNEIAISHMRRLSILSIDTTKRNGKNDALCGVCALACLLYFFTLRDTLAYGKLWGYAEYDLEKFSQALTEQADIMFKEVLTARINNYNEGDFPEPSEQAKRSIVYWTSDYTNIQNFLSQGASHKPTKVCLTRDDIMANPINDESHSVYLGTVFMTDQNVGLPPEDTGYNYLSATKPATYNGIKTSVTIPVKNAGRYHIRLYYAYMTESYDFNYDALLLLEQSGQILMDKHLTDFTETILTPYKPGSNYGPVLFRDTETELLEGELVVTLHVEHWLNISGYGYLQHVEFVKL